MSDMTACCGILCSKCDAFIATSSDDDAKRAKTAELWSKQYGMAVKPEEINCDGCRPDSSRLFSHCQVCEIRKCARDKAVANCAHCDDYACEKLEGFFKMVPDAREKLDTIKSSL